jgi:hypothetical protein
VAVSSAKNAEMQIEKRELVRRRLRGQLVGRDLVLANLQDDVNQVATERSEGF